MINRREPTKILRYETIGFLSLIALTWLDEYLGLPYVVFGLEAKHAPNWREAAMETVAVVIVWIPICFLTKRIISRLFYLEEFLRVCAWCKKVHFEGGWIPVDEFIEKGFSAKTSHGLCPDCGKKLKQEAANEAA